MTRRPREAKTITSLKPVPRPMLASEHARAGSHVEWWFFQGRYEGARSGRREFMATLFRTSLERPEGRPVDGFQLMLAVLDETGAEAGHRSTTWIESEVLEAAARRLDEDEPHIDPTLERAFTREIRAHGPPRPILLRPGPTRFEANPLRLEWGDFRLRQHDTEITLEFPEPGGDRQVQLTLTAVSTRMEVEYPDQALSLSRGGMAYHAYPRLHAAGRTSDGERIAGQVWFDHQWGDRGWLHDDDTRVTRGWDWFGINLADGSDLVVMRHRNAESGKIAASHATLRRPDGESRTDHRVTLTPLRHWSSEATFAGYPVAWRIRVPEFDADLVFEPLRDAQEIPSFGTMRAVWEGAGRVEGTLAGRPVRGRARGEFHGYAYIFEFDGLLKRMGKRIDRRLEEFLPRCFDRDAVERFVGPAHWEHDIEAYTERIARPTWDLLDRGGKRWRPILGLLLLEALGVRSGDWESLVSTLELIHAGALIVDDVEDDSLLRRGEPCIHLRYGVDVALNAGNALYFLPGAAILSHPLLDDRTRRRCLEIKERVCIQAHCGQAGDIHRSRNLTEESLREAVDGNGEARILQMYAFKTAAAAVGVAEIASVIADADPVVTAAAVDFGRDLGVAFQITDDVHNFSRAPRWTKVTGEDLRNGKLTLVILEALRRLAPDDRARLAAILCSPERRFQDPSLERAVDLVLESGAIEHCRQLARSMVDGAWARFSGHLPSSEAKIMLHTLCLELIDLAFEG